MKGSSFQTELEPGACCPGLVRVKTIIYVGGLCLSAALMVIGFMGDSLLTRMTSIDKGVASIQTSVAVIASEQSALRQRLEDHIYEGKRHP